MKSLLIRTFAATTLALTLNVSAGEQGYDLEIDGLACPFCAYGIEKQLSSVNDVKHVEIDITQGRVIVTMQENQTLSEAEAREKVQKAGFSLRRFSPLTE
ncbi:MAG: heavy-metal-associated domain-containing protein [Gammaproteobacteria bacterium]|nr:heavy-metal-associated domain-containing protein [Gammaproteobacteria bacterium]